MSSQLNSCDVKIEVEPRKKKKTKKNEVPQNTMNKSGKLLVKAAMAYAARKMTSLKLNRPLNGLLKEIKWAIKRAIERAIENMVGSKLVIP